MIINKDDKVYFSLGEWILYTLNGSLFAFYDYGEQGCKYADRTLRAENFTFAGNNHPARLLVSGDFARPGATEYLEQRLNTSPKEKEPYQLN